MRLERVMNLENMMNDEKTAGGLSALTDVLAAVCPECGSADTQWHCSQHTDSGVVDGRLRMHEVNARFFLGCNSCSETIRIIDGDDLARLMTKAANASFSRGPSGPSAGSDSSAAGETEE